MNEMFPIDKVHGRSYARPRRQGRRGMAASAHPLADATPV